MLQDNVKLFLCFMHHTVRAQR